MSSFRIEIKASGGHGCDRRSKVGEKLYGRCSRLTCADCLAYDFVQLLQQKGFSVEHATFVHAPDSPTTVIDDLVRNKRLSGNY